MASMTRSKAVREITGAARVNVLGFCIGGTLLASALAVMSKRDRERIASLTLLATMLDFSDVGEIGVYIDEAFVQQEEARFRDGGMRARRAARVRPSRACARTNWSGTSSINNYLKGQTPRAFDLLLLERRQRQSAGPMYAWYLRNMYLENNLRVPGKLRLLGRPVDFGAVRCPAFVLATREDHIVPWRSAYASTQLLAGTIEFVLAASGHIAGVVNAPRCRQAQLLGRTTRHLPNADEWLAQAQQRARKLVAALGRLAASSSRAPASMRLARSGARAIRVLEPAPGTYVRAAAAEHAKATSKLTQNRTGTASRRPAVTTNGPTALTAS